MPIGVPGEIFISGEGVSEGYINQNELTKEKFIQNPFIPSTIMYRSGDQGRYLSNGNIEFLGRSDQQVKIRGYRIELEEIKFIINSIDEIRTSVVDVKETSSGKYLVAYLVMKAEESVNPSMIRERLQSFLPDYMIPNFFVRIEKIPYSLTGKVDRKSLPDPEVDHFSKEMNAKEKTPIQEVLLNICKQILKINNIHLNDNFFDLGGHSLSATQLVSRIREAFRIEISLQSIFEKTSIQEIALLIETQLDNNLGIKSLPITPGPRNEYIPLSYAQQRLWFLEQLSPGNLFYNIPITLKLDGNLYPDILEWSLNEIVQRHEILRTSFKINGWKTCSNNINSSIFSLITVDISDMEIGQKDIFSKELIKKKFRSHSI